MEAVNHPAHYNAPNRKECIVEMIEKYGLDAVLNFCELNAYKYEYRHSMKNGQEDLDKASWYRKKKEELEQSDDRIMIANTFGLDHQKNQLIEEMSELTQAICKLNRIQVFGEVLPSKKVLGQALQENLIEEIADVKLVLEQVIFLLDAKEEVQQWMNKKVQRTIDKID